MANKKLFVILVVLAIAVFACSIGMAACNSGGMSDFQNTAYGMYKDLYSIGDRITFREGDYYGYLNKKGEVVIDALYTEATPFYKSRAVVERRGFKYLIDEKGNVKAGPYAEIQWPSEGAWIVSDKDSNRYGLIDSNGKEVLPAIYNDINSAGPDTFFVSKGAEKALVDSKGKTVIDFCEATYCSSVGDIYTMKRDGFINVYNRKGKLIAEGASEISYIGYGMYSVTYANEVTVRDENMKTLFTAPDGFVISQAYGKDVIFARSETYIGDGIFSLLVLDDKGNIVKSGKYDNNKDVAVLGSQAVFYYEGKQTYSVDYKTFVQSYVSTEQFLTEFVGRNWYIDTSDGRRMVDVFSGDSFALPAEVRQISTVDGKVFAVVNEQNMFAAMNDKGEYLTEFAYKWALPLFGGFVMTGNGGRQAVLDKNGKTIFNVSADKSIEISF